MKPILPVLAAMCIAMQLHAAPTHVPKADSEAEVVFENARFTILTSRLIRMEWAEDGKFEDRASFTVVNRRLPVPSFTVGNKGGSLVIKTEDVTLNYSGGVDFLRIICL